MIIIKPTSKINKKKIITYDTFLFKHKRLTKQ